MSDTAQIAEMQAQIDALHAQIQEQDALLGKAIHNMKNLLARVIGCDQYITGMHSDMFSELEQNLIQEADDSSFQINDIFDALSIILQIRRRPLAINPLNMETIIKGVQGQISPLITAKGAKIDLPTDWPIVVGHPFFVELIWKNLLTNAIQYCGTTPEITIRAGVLSNGTQARFSVQDNGVGLTDEQKPLMFTAFPRIQIKNPNAGGLGLYTTRLIVECLGGTIGVESEFGWGSTFTFTLPTAESPTPIVIETLT